MNLKLKFCCLIALLGLTCLKLANGFKCEFYGSGEDDDENILSCKMREDSKVAEEKHLPGKNDDDIKKLMTDDIDSLSTAEFPFCERFKNLINIDINFADRIDEDLLQKCSNLREVRIASNIKNIPENLLSGDYNLTHVRILYTDVTTLPEDIFANQKELEQVSLGANKITCLPSNIFKSLKNLQQLHIFRNRVESLNPAWFEDLQSLFDLDLSSNRIRELPKNIFSSLTNLRRLWFGYNQLKTIHSDSFGIHRSLDKVELSDNGIDSIDEKFLDNFELNWVNMRGNICTNKAVYGVEQMKKEFSECIKNYKPRVEQTVRAINHFELSVLEDSQGIEDAKRQHVYVGCPYEIECGTRNLEYLRSYDEKITASFEFPWVVALVDSSDAFICSGTLVSNKHIVTAAHCLKGKQDSHVYSTGDFSVVLGVRDYSKRWEKSRISSCVNSINIHPDWNVHVQNYDGDIAVLELVSEVPFNDHIRPVCIADKDSEILEANQGVVVGFGITENGKLSKTSRKLRVPITDYHTCTQNNEDLRPFVAERTFCGRSANGSSFCSGSSGDGHYVPKNNFYLRGLVSSSLKNDKNKCDGHNQVVLTDATKYYDWIKNGGREVSEPRSKRATDWDQKLKTDISGRYGNKN